MQIRVHKRSVRPLFLLSMSDTPKSIRTAEELLCYGDKFFRKQLRVTRGIYYAIDETFRVCGRRKRAGSSAVYEILHHGGNYVAERRGAE